MVKQEDMELEMWDAAEAVGQLSIERYIRTVYYMVSSILTWANLLWIFIQHATQSNMLKQYGW